MSMDLSNLSDIEVTGLTIYGESRGEPVEGQIAVGCIIRNRLHLHPLKYKRYYDVCLEPKQFSCWNLDDTNRAVLEELAAKQIDGQQPEPYLKQCIFIANGIVRWQLMDNTRSSEHYMTNSMFTNGRPSWSRNARNINVIGNQTFFSV